MTTIEKIRAEIERRKSLLTQHSKLTYDLILEIFIKEYDDLLSFLDTLQEEPDKVLEGEVILNGHGLLVDVTKWDNGYKLKVIIKED